MAVANDLSCLQMCRLRRAGGMYWCAVVTDGLLEIVVVGCSRWKRTNRLRLFCTVVDIFELDDFASVRINLSWWRLDGECEDSGSEMEPLRRKLSVTRVGRL